MYFSVWQKILKRVSLGRPMIFVLSVLLKLYPGHSEQDDISAVFRILQMLSYGIFPVVKIYSGVSKGLFPNRIDFHKS